MGSTVLHIDNIFIDRVLPLHVSETDEMGSKVRVRIPVVLELHPQLLHVFPHMEKLWVEFQNFTHNFSMFSHTC